ncbi:monovalent cation/H(+) antiporter subunit G [Aeromicrobium sp. PE09-221]|uniref:cation:proton antiporter n=1 Tax=Aeromicrobium sp. PE09-221 TaxID=1898043 RepID=UPI00191C72E2|nr:monovalent cation/H(+) antiporter subunit G [Aeromicrobium sp. PE09-221]
MTLLLAVGAIFMIAGTAGLLRFPDLPTRLHAVAKADNLGLGFIILGLIVHTVSNGAGAGVVVKLLLIWALALLGTAVNSHLLAVREDDG